MTKVQRKGTTSHVKPSSQRTWASILFKLTAFVLLLCSTIVISLTYHDISSQDDIKTFLDKSLTFEVKDIEFGDIHRAGGVAHLSLAYSLNPPMDSSALLILPYLLISLTEKLKQITLVESNAALILPEYAGNNTILRLHVSKTTIPIVPFLEHSLMLSSTVELLENGPIFKLAADAYRKRIESITARFDLDATISILGLPSIRLPLKKTIHLDPALLT